MYMHKHMHTHTHTHIHTHTYTHTRTHTHTHTHTCRIFSKVSGWEFAPFSTVVWNECYSMPDKTQLCAKIDIGIARQIWEMFLWLDIDSQSKIHVEDICDFILRILRENGHSESEQNIREWFCGEVLVDFWSFFAAIVENYVGLLKVRKRNYC